LALKPLISDEIPEKWPIGRETGKTGGHLHIKIEMLWIKSLNHNKLRTKWIHEYLYIISLCIYIRFHRRLFTFVEIHIFDGRRGERFAFANMIFSGFKFAFW